MHSHHHHRRRRIRSRVPLLVLRRRLAKMRNKEMNSALQLSHLRHRATIRTSNLSKCVRAAHLCPSPSSTSFQKQSKTLLLRQCVHGIAYDKMFNTLDSRDDTHVELWMYVKYRTELRTQITMSRFGAAVVDPGIWLEHQATPAHTQQSATEEEENKNAFGAQWHGVCVCVCLEQHLWKEKGVCRCHLHMRHSNELCCFWCKCDDIRI